MDKISMQLFGTTDYQSVLDVLAPSDGLVKEFYRRVNDYKRNEGLK